MTTDESRVGVDSRRARRIADVCELVIQVMNLRPPQALALRKMAGLLQRLPRPLPECDGEAARQFLTEGGLWEHAAHPSFTISVATGVGKTRLAGAVMALLYLARESRTFLVLAPRRAVLRRFSDALDPAFREYLFVEQGFVPEPYVVASDQIADPAGVEAMPDAFRTGPTIYLLSPQLISTSNRFAGKNAFTGISPADHLREKQDLVVIADEAHHVGGVGKAEAAKWTEAIRALAPKLQLGLTATPRGEAGENILYDYPLAQALAEQLYTKDVHLLVRRFDTNLVPEEDIDLATIAFALDRLASKEGAISRSQVAPFPHVKPVCVFFAKDIEHAEWVRSVLLNTHELSEEEILTTHSRSSKSDEEVERLLSIEALDNPVRVVVNVQELTEGWDVRNVYVVAPLRAMATFQGALQAMGRGLRLPAGKRVQEPELDSLDVICFGRSSLKNIVEDATTWLGKDIQEGTGVIVDDYQAGSLISIPLTIPLRRSVESLRFAELETTHEEITVNVPPEAIKSSVTMAVEDLELARLRSKYSRDRLVRIPRQAFVTAATMRVLRAASKYLSDDEHFDSVRNVVTTWLDEANADDEAIDFDPVAIGEEIGKILVDSARRRALEYQQTGRELEIVFPEFQVALVRTTNDSEKQASIENLRIVARDNFRPGEVIRGLDGHAWSQSLHPAYKFDSFPEVQLSWHADHAEEVDWWVRNDPKRLRIPTPAGFFSPDFVIQLSENGPIQIIEVKADRFWQSPESEDRIKASSATRWAEAQSDASGRDIRFGVALESEINSASSFGSLLQRLRTS